MTGALNNVLTGFFDLVFRPFLSLNPLWALGIVSLVTGVLALWIFGKVSNQDKIHVIRDRIRGNLIAIRLFGNDLGVLFRLQGRILGQTLVYLGHAFVPLLIMIVPIVAVCIQLNLRYSVRPLAPGDRAIVKVKVDDPSVIEHGVALEVPDGVVRETPPVRAASIREVSWRIRADAPGRHRLLVRAGKETAIEKELVVGPAWGATPTLRTSRLLDLILYPGEDPIAAESGIESVEVLYPPLEMKLYGWNLDWLLVFFVLSIAFGFAFKKPLGVEI